MFVAKRSRSRGHRKQNKPENSKIITTMASTTNATTTPSSSSSANALLRDMDELEGTILVPDARAVADDADTCVVATALPTTYFQYEDNSSHVSSNNNNGVNYTYNAIAPISVEIDGDVYNSNNVPEAAVIPTDDLLQKNTIARDNKNALKVAEQRGLVDNEQQREDIQRANQKVASIAYFAGQQVQEANRLAHSTNRKEEAQLLFGTTTATTTMTTDKISDSKQQDTTTISTTMTQQNKKKDPEYYQNGTFGKEYKTSDYKISDYKTSSEYTYTVSEYKSVYE